MPVYFSHFLCITFLNPHTFVLIKFNLHSLGKRENPLDFDIQVNELRLKYQTANLSVLSLFYFV